MEEEFAKEELKLKRRAKKELIFNIISISLIIGCCIFYGLRLIKYYKIFNPKIEAKIEGLLSNTIPMKSDIVYNGAGLYHINGNYLYKGASVNNYIKYSNLLWRVVKINSDNTTEIILNDTINTLAWNKSITSYNKSDINSYLNNYFLPTLNKKLLTKTSICLDKVTNLSDITCNKMDFSNYVKLLDITTFLNSQTSDSYIADSDDILWFNDNSDDKVWHSNGLSISSSTSNNFYDIKPVVTLKNTIQLKSGTGTIDDPYIIENQKKDLAIGSYVKLGNDTWIIYNNENNKVKLILNKFLSNTHRFDNTSNKYNPESTNSLAYYLNTTYLNSLTYKNIIVDNDWYIGTYNYSYANTLKDKVTTKVGLYNIADLKFNNDLIGYNLLTPASNNSIYVLNDGLFESKVTLNRLIRPAISISETTTIISGDGTKTSPYVLEV